MKTGIGQGTGNSIFFKTLVFFLNMPEAVPVVFE